MGNMIHSQFLTKLGTNDEISATVLATGASVSSNPVDTALNHGYSTLLITALTNSTITVNYQVSDDKVNFYDPVDTNFTSLGSILSTVTTAAASVTRWIVFSPQVARWMRFWIVRSLSRTGISSAS